MAQGLNIHVLMLEQSKIEKPNVEKRCAGFAWGVGQDHKTWI
jgi:hypothetical protein